MPDDHEVLLSLNSEQVLERAKASELELEYWRKVIDDLHELNYGIHAVAAELERSTLAVLGLLPLVKQAGAGSLETIVNANDGAMRRLRLMQETSMRTLDLVNGRSVVHSETAAAIAEAAGVELKRDDDQADEHGRHVVACDVCGTAIYVDHGDPALPSPVRNADDGTLHSCT